MFDRLLRQMIAYLENLQVGLARVGEYVLDFVSRTFESILRLVRRAISIVYRFIRDLLKNLIKIIWHLFQLALVPMVFLFVWAFGSELWKADYWKIGVLLELFGVAGTALVFIALLASLNKTKRDETLKESDHRNASWSKAMMTRVAFFIMNLIALGIVLFITFFNAHWFSNPILRVSQIAACRVLVVALSVSKEGSQSHLMSMTRDALGPPPSRAETLTLKKDYGVTHSREARRPEAFGTVTLDILVGSDGKVRIIKVIDSVPLIDNEVLDAVYQREYAPMVVEGKAVPFIASYAYTWAGDSMPSETFSQISGPTEIKDSVFSGTIKNSSNWTVGWITVSVKGPYDPSAPIQWQRQCEISAIIPPGKEMKFSCEIAPVNTAIGFRWDIKAAWGLPH